MILSERTAPPLFPDRPALGQQVRAEYPVATARVAVRFRGNPRSSDSAIRGAVRQISPDTAVSDLLALAVIGLHGVLSYQVRQSTRGIGIRVAIGAPPASVVGHVARHGFGTATAGLIPGTLMAAGSAQFLRSLLFSISAYDPLVYSAVRQEWVSRCALRSTVNDVIRYRLNPTNRNNSGRSTEGERSSKQPL
jgi:hypothetical protein